MMNPTPECDIFKRRSSYFSVARTTELHMFCRMANHQLKIVYRLLTRLNIVCHLKMHADLITVRGQLYGVCVNQSAIAIFYCKIALINRFKLYLIKIFTIGPKTKDVCHVNKNNVYLIFAFSGRHVTVCHYNDKRSRSTVYHYNDTRSTVTR